MENRASGHVHSRRSGWLRCWRRWTATWAVRLVAAGMLMVCAGGPLATAASADSAQAAAAVLGQQVQTAALATAFEMTIRHHDGGALSALFHDGALIKERNAVLAAGTDRVREWLHECVARDFSLELSAAVLGDGTATWRFQDWSNCYERTRPGSLRPGWDVNPATGVVQLVAQEDRIGSLVFTYDPEWEARRLTAMAVPIRAAMAQATLTAQLLAASLPGGETLTAAGQFPGSPDTQGRTTGSPAAWVAGIVLTLLGTGLAALARPAPAAGDRAR